MGVRNCSHFYFSISQWRFALPGANLPVEPALRRPSVAGTINIELFRIISEIACERDHHA